MSRSTFQSTQQIFSLGNQKPEMRFYHHAHAIKVYVANPDCVADNAMDQSQEILSEFEKQYQFVCKAREPHYTWFQKLKNLFRDDMLQKLEKMSEPQGKKLQFLINHMTKNPMSRTAFALHKTIYTLASKNTQSKSALHEDEQLKKDLSMAQKLLDSVLTAFHNDYLFDPISSTPISPENLKKLEKKIVEAYLLIKNNGGSHAISHYNQLIKDILYPNYLYYSLFQASICVSQKFRFSIAESLFAVSNVIDESDHLIIMSEKKDDVAKGPSFFSKRELTHSRDDFEMECLTRWANLSLQTMRTAGLIEEVIFQTIQEKMHHFSCDRKTQLSFERILYLQELIQREKWIEAKREAQAIKKVYADFFCDRNSKQCHLLSNIFLTYLATLKEKIISESENLVSTALPYGIFLQKVNLLETQWRKQLDALSEIRYILFSDSLIEHYKAINAVSDGLRATYALSTITERALANAPFDYQVMSALAPHELGVNHPIVWIGTDETKKQLSNKIYAALDVKESEMNLSRVDLLHGLHRCIQKIHPVSILRNGNATASALNKSDVALIYRGVLGTQNIQTFLNKMLTEILNYHPIQKAINRFSHGGVLSLRDPTLSSTRLLIENPTVNYFKYEHIFALYHSIQNFMQELSMETVFNSKNYHFKILQQFGKMVRHIESIQKDIHEKHKDQMGKTFDQMLFDKKTKLGILTSVMNAQKEWQAYCLQLNGNLNLDESEKISVTITRGN